MHAHAYTDTDTHRDPVPADAHLGGVQVLGHI